METLTITIPVDESALEMEGAEDAVAELAAESARKAVRQRLSES
jgi:hypothetical protein